MQVSIADVKIPLEKLEILSRVAGCAATKAKEYKEVELVPGDKTKLAHIRPDLDPK